MKIQSDNPLITLEMREQIRRKRKELKMTLSDVVKKSIKKGMNPPLSVSTISSVERGDLVRIKIQKLKMLFDILQLDFETQDVKKISFGISTELEEISKEMAEEFCFYFTMENLKISYLPNKELLNELRSGVINVALVNSDIVLSRRMEFMPVVRITSSICLVVLGDEKDLLRDVPEYRTFFAKDWQQ